MSNVAPPEYQIGIVQAQNRLEKLIIDQPDSFQDELLNFASDTLDSMVQGYEDKQSALGSVTQAAGSLSESVEQLQVYNGLYDKKLVLVYKPGLDDDCRPTLQVEVKNEDDVKKEDGEIIITSEKVEAIPAEIASGDKCLILDRFFSDQDRATWPVDEHSSNGVVLAEPCLIKYQAITDKLAETMALTGTDAIPAELRQVFSGTISRLIHQLPTGDIPFSVLENTFQFLINEEASHLLAPILDGLAAKRIWAINQVAQHFGLSINATFSLEDKPRPIQEESLDKAPPPAEPPVEPPTSDEPPPVAKPAAPPSAEPAVSETAGLPSLSDKEPRFFEIGRIMTAIDEIEGMDQDGFIAEIKQLSIVPEVIPEAACKGINWENFQSGREQLGTELSAFIDQVQEIDATCKPETAFLAFYLRTKITAIVNKHQKSYFNGLLAAAHLVALRATACKTERRTIAQNVFFPKKMILYPEEPAADSTRYTGYGEFKFKDEVPIFQPEAATDDVWSGLIDDAIVLLNRFPDVFPIVETEKK